MVAMSVALALRGEKAEKPQPSAPADVPPEQDPDRRIALPQPDFGEVAQVVPARLAPPLKRAAQSIKPAESEPTVDDDAPIAPAAPAAPAAEIIPTSAPIAPLPVAEANPNEAPASALVGNPTAPPPAPAGDTPQAAAQDATDSSAIGATLPVPPATALVFVAIPKTAAAPSSPAIAVSPATPARPVDIAPSTTFGSNDGLRTPQPPAMRVTPAPLASVNLPKPMFGQTAAEHVSNFDKELVGPPPSLQLPEPQFGFAVAPPAPALSPGHLAAAMPHSGRVANPLGPVEPTTTPASFARPAAALAITGAAPPAGPTQPALSPTPARAPAGTMGVAPRFSADDELIFQIETVRHELADTLIGYQWRGQTYLPLGTIARFLDLAISISDDGHYASGWVLDPKHTLAINLRDGTMTIDGQTRKIAPGDAAAFDGELFLRTDRFADILPLSLTTSLRAQTVTVKTRVPFPFEDRAQREDAREHLAARRGNEGAHHWPREDTPYQALSFPLADLETRAMSDQTRGPRVENDLRLAGDLAFLTARAYISTSTRDGLTAAHIEMGRRDADANLLGPLNATDFSFGDVSSIAMPLGLGAATGRGAAVGNAPLEHASVFDTIDFKGDLPDGYEVELYRNGLLIDSTRAQVGGQYQFLRVPVDFGLNLFRLVFYGPQGQRREVIRQISVGDGRLSKGEFIYTAGVLQKSVNVLDVQGPNFIPGQDYGAWRSAAQVQYGLSSAVTATAALAAYQSLGTWHWLTSAGARYGIGGVAMKLDIAAADHGGKAVEAAIGGRLAGFSYKLTHVEYFGQFVDEVRSYSNDYLHRATEGSLNGALRLGGGDHPIIIPIYAFARQIDYADGRQLTDLTFHQSMSATSHLMLSNTLGYNRTVSTNGTSTAQTTGAFDLATMSGSRTQYRVTLDYALTPSPQVTTAMVEVDHSIGDHTLLRGGVSHLITAGQTQIGLSAVRRYDRFTVAMDGSYTTGSGQYSAMLRMGFSFGRNPFTGSLFIAPPGLSTGGAAAIRAYRDNNGNHVFDDGDTVIPGVAFNTGTEHAATDSSGVAFLGKLGDGQRTNIQVDADALPDVSLAPATKGIEIAPRAGRIHVSNFAIVSMSEIDGTAFFVESGRDKAVSGLVLLLIDAKGKRVARTRTTSDGGFWFEAVRAGDYAITLDPGQAANLKIRMQDAAHLTIGNAGATIRQIIRVGGTGG